MATYETLGVKRVINASANNSRLGGSCMDDAVLNSMVEAAKSYIDMTELHKSAGNAIAKLINAESALVTSGAAAGLLLAVSACITHSNTAKMLDLPAAANGSEIIIQKGQRTGYDQGIRLTGVKVIEVGLPSSTRIEEIEYSINENTVALLYAFSELSNDLGMVSLEKFIQIGKDHKIPVIIDAAVANYPPEKLRAYSLMGANLVSVSGAKHIYGPPGTGFIFGDKDLIESCRLQAGPEYGIGRPMKVGKEEIIGLVTALEIYMNRNHEAEQKIWESKVSFIQDSLKNLPHTVLKRIFPDEVGRPVPRIQIKIDEKKMGLSAFEIAKHLLQNNPPIYVTSFYLNKGIIVINPIGLQIGDEDLIIDAFKAIWNM